MAFGGRTETIVPIARSRTGCRRVPPCARKGCPLTRSVRELEQIAMKEKREGSTILAERSSCLLKCNFETAVLGWEQALIAGSNERMRDRPCSKMTNASACRWRAKSCICCRDTGVVGVDHFRNSYRLFLDCCRITRKPEIISGWPTARTRFPERRFGPMAAHVRVGDFSPKVPRRRSTQRNSINRSMLAVLWKGSPKGRARRISVRSNGMPNIE
jgi:hypothetical protein